PVRVVRRSRHQVVIGLGIHLTAGIAHTYFYPQHVYGPGSLKLPFAPGILLRDISAFGGVDGRDLRGWRYFAPGTPPDGFAVDGHMDERERAFASSGEWFVLAHGSEALLFVTRMSENLRRAITLSLVYRDDASRPNPPEDVPGTVPLVGYRARAPPPRRPARHRAAGPRPTRRPRGAARRARRRGRRTGGARPRPRAGARSVRAGCLPPPGRRRTPRHGR